MESSHLHSNTTYLLKTAVAPVIAGHIRRRANILFDEGAQRSFISAEMAARLYLQPTTTQTMALASFGANTASYQELGAVTIEIETITGDRIPISVLVIPSIAAPIQSSINTSVRNMLYLQGLKLAHPVTSDHKFEIGLLIGTDYYWSFIQDHIVRGQGPTAQQSKLGYLLSGPVPSSPQEASSLILLQLTSTTTAPHEPDLEHIWSIEAIGRIHNAPVSEMAKFPYLLPPRHTLTNMIIQQTHKKFHHAGVNAIVTALRQVFWIPTIRQRVKTQLRQCVVCNRLMGKPYQAPDPPPLPRIRVQVSQPFSITGVDFTGALYVKDSTGERKVYICLFTCACTRAVHLKLVCDLSVDSFFTCIS